MRILRTKHLPCFIKALTIGPCIITHPLTVIDETDERHEQIHWEQQKELLIVLFLVWYAVEFAVKLLLTWSWHRAYRSLSFEQEAYVHQSDRYYLGSRRRYSWLRYVCKLKS